MQRKPVHHPVPPSLVEEAILRARDQEDIYGHNTGHFTLETEKQNTIIGVLGELIVRDYLLSRLTSRREEVFVELSPIGSQYDILIRILKEKRELHVKSGLWRSWPREDWHFGIHSDQYIQDSGAPLVLVSFLRSKNFWPSESRIEGYIKSEQLKKATLIRSGERFPSTGVVSRTDNLLTRFSDYQDIQGIEQWLHLKQS
jgi:hypothetical protein